MQGFNVKLFNNFFNLVTIIFTILVFQKKHDHFIEHRTIRSIISSLKYSHGNGIKFELHKPKI